MSRLEEIGLRAVLRHGWFQVLFEINCQLGLVKALIFYLFTSWKIQFKWRLCFVGFQTFPPLYCHKVRPNVLLNDYRPSKTLDGHYVLQKGISRTNCVDCLDRTNVVQFGIGRSFCTNHGSFELSLFLIL